jgi:Flp pilus assembly pilin Flp
MAGKSAREVARRPIPPPLKPQLAGGELSRPRPHPFVDHTGQATTEYAGLLALIATALLGAGMLVGLDDVGAAVAKGIRTGICIVGGDVCRASDAAAAGLEPCTVGERSRGGGATLSVAWFRIGDRNGWSVATRSDGSVLVTRSHARKAGAAAGIGVEASPFGLSIGVEGKADFEFGSGATWEFPDAESAARFIAHGGDVEPTWRFGEAGDVLTAEAGVKIGGATLTGVEATAQSAGGARVGRGQTTLYIRTRMDSGSSVWLGNHTAEMAGPSTGEVIVELTLEHGRLREVAFRTARSGAGPGHVVDTVARLDLRDQTNRAAAAHLITQELPWPPAVAREVHDVMLYTVQHGTVERSVYDVRDESSDFELAARLGEELGIEVNRVKVQRRLIAASAWTPGSQERLREDCVM